VRASRLSSPFLRLNSDKIQAVLIVVHSLQVRSTMPKGRKASGAKPPATKGAKTRRPPQSASSTPTFDTVRELACSLPGVEDGTSYGTPALKVKKKLMVRLREDGDVVFVLGFDKRDMLMAARPEAFYTTDHYRDYPSVLVRLSEVTLGELWDCVRWAWEVRK
jgi:hypothetical protein